jgi:hypothetical protein
MKMSMQKEIKKKKKKKRSKMHIYINIFDVKGSYPEPPEAKLTPVGRSLGCKFGSLYAGRSSLIHNSSTEKRKKKKRITD